MFLANLTIYDPMHGNFPAKNTVYKQYIGKYAWFWPALIVYACFKARTSLGLDPRKGTHPGFKP